THDLNAPNGRARAELVATTHRTSQPLDPAEIVASRAIRLLPTPAAPRTTIPEQSRSANAASMSRISLDLPVSGNVNRIQLRIGAVTARLARINATFDEQR